MKRVILPKTVVLPEGCVLLMEEEETKYSVSVPIHGEHKAKFSISEEAVSALLRVAVKPHIE